MAESEEELKSLLMKVKEENEKASSLKPSKIWQPLPPPHTKLHHHMKVRSHIEDIHLMLYLQNILSTLLFWELLLATLKNHMVLVQAANHSIPSRYPIGWANPLALATVTGSHMDMWPYLSQSESFHEIFLRGLVDSAPFILWSEAVKTKPRGASGHVSGWH